jgi:ATP-binding cassette, subfamily G (WHITE), eye pigment precursor transporter
LLILIFKKAVCDGYAQSEYSHELRKDIDESNSKVTGSSVIFKSETNESGYKSNSFTQLRWLTWRNVIATVRNPMDTKIGIMQAIIIALLFGLIFLQQELTQEGVQNINGVLFLFITNMSFSNMFAVINSFPAELPIFYREHQNGMYRVINYYMSKVISDVIFIFFRFNSIIHDLIKLFSI